MRKISFSAISILCIICICLCALPQAFAVDNNTPKLPDNTETIISNDGIETTFGDKYNSITANTKFHVDDTDSVDLSSAEKIEFDVYVENSQDVHTDLDAKTLSMLFALSSKNNKTLSSTSNYETVDILPQITKDGWNHISVKKSDFTSAKSIDWSNIRYVFLKYSANDSSSLNKIKDKTLKIKNVCTVTVIPEIPGNSVVLSQKIISNTLGETANSKLTEIKARFYENSFETTDISESKYLYFDIKNTCVLGLKNLLENKNAKAYFVLYSGEVSAKAEFISSLRDIGALGWTNAIIEKTDFKTDEGFDFGGITAFAIDIVSENSNETLDSFYSSEITLTNVCGITVPAKESDNYFGKIKTNIVSENSVFVSKKYNEFSYVVDASGTLNGSTYLEMNMFVEDYDCFKQSFTKSNDNSPVDISLSLTLTNTSDNELVFKNIEKKIAGNGFNHIIIPISEGVGAFDVSSALKSVKLSYIGSNTDLEKTNLFANRLLILDDVCATEESAPEENNANKKITDVSPELNKTKLGNTFSNSSFNITRMTSPVDFSSAVYVEFDFYVQNYDLLMSQQEKANASNISMRFSSSDTDAEIDKCSRSSTFLSALTKSGWNHVVIPFSQFTKGSTSGDMIVSSIKAFKVYYNGQTGNSTGELAGNYSAISNVCITKFDMEEKYNGSNTVDTKFDTPTAIGSYGKNYSLTMTGVAKESTDMTNAFAFEFDLYVSDYEKFANSFVKDKNGKDVGVVLNFGLGVGNAYNEPNGCIYWYGIQQQIKNSGWNHIVLTFGGQSGSKNYATTLSQIQNWKIWYGGDAYKKGDYENTIADELCVLANFYVTKLEAPEKPSNALAQVGTGKKSTLGEKLHYLSDRIYEEKLEAVDLTDATSIEFDIWVDNYELLLEAESKSSRNSMLSLCLSSTPSALWGQYSKPRAYYSAYAVISDKITQNGWNHIKLGKEEFIKYNHGINWSNVNAWMLHYVSSSNYYPENNEAKNVTVYVTNIVGCGYKANIEADPSKQLQPDTSAVYISSAETKVDDYGSWTGSTLYVNNKYKTDGEASIGCPVTYTSTPEEVNMAYIFDETADMSDIKELKFDLFVDFPNFFAKSGNIFKVVLANDRKANNDYYEFTIDGSGFSSGWNSVSVDINKFGKVGNPNISEVKAIIIRAEQINLSNETFEAFNLSIDNLRYLSKTGNRTLKINSIDDIDTDDYDYDDYDLDDDEDLEPEEDYTGQTKIKNVKKVMNITQTNYIPFIIIVSSVFAVSVLGVVLFVIIFKKKRLNK